MLIILFLDYLKFVFGSIEFSVPIDAVDMVMTYLDFAAYFVPIGTIAVLFGFMIAKEATKIFIAFLKLVIKFVPFMG